MIVHESAWTATARHADIVLPATITLEREDIGALAGRSADGRDAPGGRRRSAKRETITRSSPGSPSGSGQREAFTEGRSARQWLEHLYEPTRRALIEHGVDAPDFEEFWEDGELRSADPSLGMAAWCGRSAAIPKREPLPTPSGKIEIASAAIAGFGYADCPAHPTWLPPVDGAGSPRGALSAASDRQPAGDPAAQPARFRRDQPRVESPRPRAGAHSSAGRRRARHSRRRYRPALQRAGRLPCRRGAERCVAARGRPACDRRVVNPLFDPDTPGPKRRSAYTATRTC